MSAPRQPPDAARQPPDAAWQPSDAAWQPSDAARQPPDAAWQPTDAAWKLPGVPEPPAWDLDWPGLLARLPVLAPLGDCPQDPEWHPEGDVLTHTRRVVEALVASPDWRALPAAARSVIFTAALFHDVAKPETTAPDAEGRLIAPRHASRGAQRVRRLLYRCTEVDVPPPPLALREQIVALVRHHGLPLWWLDRDPPERAAIRATLRVPGRWLALLSEADVRGRDGQDRRDLLDRLEGFRDLCRETGCLEAPRRFVDAVTRQAFLAGRWLLPDTPAYDGSRFEVLMLSGFPGAGKDTWLVREASGLPVVSLDAERARLGVDPTGSQGAVIQAAREAARVLLRQERPFAWNATHLTRSLRQSVLRLLGDYGARVRIVYLEPTYEELLRRNQERPTPVPLSVVERLVERWELPELDEAAEVEWRES